VATLPEGLLIAFILAAGATGVAYYGYSSLRIGRHFGMASVPYAAVYAALLVTTLAPTIQAVDRNVAVLMALVAWGLYTRTLMGSRAAKRHAGVQAALIFVGFFALVVFPLLHLLFPEAQSGLPILINLLYRLAAVVGWVLGARPGFGPKK
jgi:hypothetical protein